MGSFLDSGAAQLGESLGGGATGGIAGFVQGLQLKQQMQKQALEELQMQRALQNPHITALAHGAYLVQDPVTGRITPHQQEGTLPGGPQGFAITNLLKNPNDELAHKIMRHVFANSPELTQSKIGNYEALAEQHKQQAQAANAIEQLRLALAAEVAKNAAANRGVKEATIENLGSSTQLNMAKTDEVPKMGESQRKVDTARIGELGASQALKGAQKTTEQARPALIQEQTKVQKQAAKLKEREIQRMEQRIEHDKNMSPLQQDVERAKIERYKKSGTTAQQNTVTIGPDALGRPSLHQTFKDPKDAQAVLQSYQQWKAPLKNLEVGIFESKAKKLDELRARWIETKHPSEAEIAGFDQAMQEVK